MDEPVLRLWMQEGVEPRVAYDERPGRWVAEPAWPPPTATTRSFALNPGALDEAALPETALAHCSPQHLGVQAGPWGHPSFRRTSARRRRAP